MSPADAEIYTNTLQTWVGEHPFLGGDSSASGASSAVFDAVIATEALKSMPPIQDALQRELRRGDAANPFLYAFYLDQGTTSKPEVLPGEHIGVIYSSLRASLAQGETANLLVEEPDDSDGQATLADVEIELARRGQERPTILKFKADAMSSIYLGSYVKDVAIIMPQARVEIGQNAEVSLIAPVEIECRELAVLAEKVIADNPPDAASDAILLEAATYSGLHISTVPAVRNDTKIFVSWPGSQSYPWNNFAAKPSITQHDDPRVREGLRRFRKFVVEFRANKNGGLARSRDKIESIRMTKGAGQAVLAAMLDVGILTHDQDRYYLHTGPLGELTETTYAGCMAYEFGPKTIAFVQDALESV